MYSRFIVWVSRLYNWSFRRSMFFYPLLKL